MEEANNQRTIDLNSKCSITALVVIFFLMLFILWLSLMLHQSSTSNTFNPHLLLGNLTKLMEVIDDHLE